MVRKPSKPANDAGATPAQCILAAQRKRRRWSVVLHELLLPLASTLHEAAPPKGLVASIDDDTDDDTPLCTLLLRQVVHHMSRDLEHLSTERTRELTAMLRRKKTISRCQSNALLERGQHCLDEWYADETCAVKAASADATMLDVVSFDLNKAVLPANSDQYGKGSAPKINE